MAVTTTTTNKPLNPRAQDLSPKGYNRAALYSGKALDFDGVNDKVDLPTLSFDLYAFSFYYEGAITTGSGQFIFHTGDGTNDGISIGSVTSLVSGETLMIGDSGNYTAVTESFDDAIHFIVCTWNATENKYNFYLNAQKLSTINSGTDAPLISLSTAPAIGYRKAIGDMYLNGKISNVRAFSTALTAAQVADLYSNPEKIVPTGVANSALKLWLPMQEGAGTTVYNGAPDALGSNVVTNGTFDTDLTGWSTNDFSNGSIVQSSGTALITSNGGSGYPSIWQQVSTIVGERYIVKANFSNNTTGIWFWKFDDNVFLGLTNRVQFINNDATASIDAIFEFTATSTLSSISAFAEQGNAGSFNLDNVEVLQISNIGTISGATWTRGIGAPVAQTSVIDWNKHTLDGINEVLIPQGLTAGRDLLGNLFENPRNAFALNLDGASWAEVHDNASVDLTDNISLECWYYNDGATDKGLLGKFYSGKSSYLLWVSSTQNSVRMFTNNSSSTKLGLSLGWHHVVGTYDGANRKLYVDGVLEDADAYTTDMTTSDEAVEIGRYFGTSNTALTNQIALPRIYNRALTATEVARNYNADKSKFGL